MMTQSDSTRLHPRVGIVILNWNQADDTLACLKSLESLDYPNYEIVLVDNGSVDGSPDMIAEQFPAVPMIRNPENLGFAGGNNVGIHRLIERGCDYILLLNNDTEVDPAMIQTLVDVGETDPRIGVLGPKIYYFKHANVIWSAGGRINKYGEASHIRIDELDSGAQESPNDVDYVTGCAILVKREVIQAIGALDGRFFIYFEESEWCTRARHAGFRVVYVPQARMWHKIEPTARNTSRRYLFLMARNRLLYLRCSGASPLTIGLAIGNLMRTSLAWALKPEHRENRPYSTALMRAVGHFLIGRFGAPPLRP